MNSGLLGANLSSDGWPSQTDAWNGLIGRAASVGAKVRRYAVRFIIETQRESFGVFSASHVWFVGHVGSSTW